MQISQQRVHVLGMIMRPCRIRSRVCSLGVQVASHLFYSFFYGDWLTMCDRGGTNKKSAQSPWPVKQRRPEFFSPQSQANWIN